MCGYVCRMSVQSSSVPGVYFVAWAFERKYLRSPLHIYEYILRCVGCVSTTQLVEARAVVFFESLCCCGFSQEASFSISDKNYYSIITCKVHKQHTDCLIIQYRLLLFSRHTHFQWSFLIVYTTYVHRKQSMKYRSYRWMLR